MDTHQHSTLRCPSAPDSASCPHLAEVASAAADAVGHAGLSQQKESAQAAQAALSREQNEHVNSDTNANAAKAFHSLRAELALRGYCLHHTSVGIYIVARWNLSRSLADLEGVKQFLRRVAT